MYSIQHIVAIAFVFLGVHALSLGAFFYAPVRPIFFFLFAGGATMFMLARPQFLLLPMTLSFFLDSSGHLFEWQGISLRLLLLAITMTAWCWHVLHQRTLMRTLRTRATVVLVVVFAAVVFATLRGYAQGHVVRQIIGDAIPYLYLLLFYPIREAWQQYLGLPEEERTSYRQWITELVIGSFIGAAIVSVIVLVLFSARFQTIHGPFYGWWRDWVAGKATYAGDGFYRVVSPLHLLLTTLIPMVAYQLWSTVSRTRFFLLAFILLVPTLNFSRMYFLALIPAIIVMMIALPRKKVIATLFVVFAIMLGEYAFVNLAVSRGKSLGSQFLLQQSEAIIVAEREGSTAARASILPHLFEKIKTRPLWGEGLGATVTYDNPFLKRTVTTPHLDWGYLELTVEFGILFAVLLVSLIVLLSRRLRREPWAMSMIVFLLVTTLTTPALFHVLGIVLITTLAAFADTQT